MITSCGPETSIVGLLLASHSVVLGLKLMHLSQTSKQRDGKDFDLGCLLVRLFEGCHMHLRSRVRFGGVGWAGSG